MIRLKLGEAQTEKFLRLMGEGGYQSPEPFVEEMLSLVDSLYAARSDSRAYNELIVRNSKTKTEKILTRRFL